jgi:hypothetical protein
LTVGIVEGLAQADADAAPNQLDSELVTAVAVLGPCDLLQALRRPCDLSRRHTIKEGYRSFDLLHVAIMLHLACRRGRMVKSGLSGRAAK